MMLVCYAKLPDGCIDAGSCDCEWKKFDSAINSSTDARISQSKTIIKENVFVAFWSINALTVDDSGTYQCVCSFDMPAGTPQQNMEAVNVTVVESVAPHFGNTISHTLDVERGSKVNLICPAEGVPEPWIDWLEDERHLSFYEGTASKNYVASSDRRSLVVLVTQSSLFACIAHNTLGQSRLNITVNARDAPLQLPPSLIVVCTVFAIFLILLGVALAVRFLRIRSKCVNLRNTAKGILAKSAKRSITLDGVTFPYPMLPNHVTDELKIPFSRIKEGEYLNSGAFGMQFRGTLYPTDDGTIIQEVAIKVLKLETASIGLFLKDALIMQKFNHPNIMRLTGIIFLKWAPLIVTPFMKNGDLRRYLRDAIHVIKTWDVLKFASSIAQGMEYLHSKRVVHRDLACRNCMLDEELEVKIGDFGLCRDVDYAGTYVSTRDDLLLIRWMAPESIKDSLYSTKTDVWAYGVLLWELTSRCAKEPYSELEVAEEKSWARTLLGYIKNGYRLEQPVHCPDAVYTLMLGCFQLNDSNRPDFTNVASHLNDVRQGCEQEIAVDHDASDNSGTGTGSKLFRNSVIPVLGTFEIHDSGCTTAALSVNTNTKACSCC